MLTPMRSLTLGFLLFLSGLTWAPAQAQEIEPTYLEIIFDASGSMEKETDRAYSRELKVRIARDEIKSFVARLGRRPGLKVALRVFGTERERRCEDVRLLQEFAPVSDDMLARIDTISPAPFGMTPIARSLELALDDFMGIDEESPNKAVLLITDGIETCDGDVDGAVSKISAANVDLRIHIVGFDVLDWEDPAQKKLQEAAKATGGEVMSPKTREELEEDLASIAEKEAPVEADAPPPPPASLMDKLKENIIVLVVVAVVMGLVLAFILIRLLGRSEE